MPVGTAHAQSPVTLVVVSGTENSQQTFGYYVSLSQGGNVVESGFTTANFTITPGQTYSIQADNYGGCTFAYWVVPVQGGNNDDQQNPYTFTAPSSYSDLTAVYDCSSNNLHLTVSTVDQNGDPISGYYTVLNQSNTILATGYTTAQFNVGYSQEYTVQVDNYGSCTFSHWANDGDTTFYTQVIVVADTGLTAVMNCSTGSTSSVTVNSENQNGQTISGYYVVLSGSAGTESGFTSTTYSTIVGQSYTIQADSYGSCIFSHWSNGATSDPMPFTATTSAQTFTAVYDC